MPNDYPSLDSADPTELAARNVGFRLRSIAERWPDLPAVIELTDRRCAAAHRSVSFSQLDRDTDRIAAGLRAMGAAPGSRIVIAVPPGIDFVSTVIAMLKARLTMILIDPGMPKRHLIQCLADAQPDGFLAIPKVHMVRSLLRRRFPSSRYHIVAGRARRLGQATLDDLRASTAALPSDNASLDDAAAIIFTTGSTGPPKGVFYSHRQFAKQIDEIRDRFRLQPAERDLAAFPLFGLFNSMMGTTTVFPAMDYTRPAAADPRHIVDALREWKITRSFGSPAFWNTVVSYCDEANETLAPLQMVFSAGAPVPVHVIERLLPRLAEGGDIWTPYGATEALPVAAMSGRNVLEETAARTAAGAGTCVGSRFPGIEWKVIAIDDGPLPSIDKCRELPQGEIGELIVRGDVVTRRYVTRTDANALHKIADGDSFWHRMGDVGYLDDQDRFWFCGRKSHRVITASGTLYTVPCEAVFNEHPRVFRSALVGVGERPAQQPVIIVQTWPGQEPRGRKDWQQLQDELRTIANAHDHTRSIAHFLWRKRLPTDIRHNAKIFREELAVWAARKMGKDLLRAARNKC